MKTYCLCPYGISPKPKGWGEAEGRSNIASLPFSSYLSNWLLYSPQLVLHIKNDLNRAVKVLVDLVPDNQTVAYLELESGKTVYPPVSNNGYYKIEVEDTLSQIRCSLIVESRYVTTTEIIRNGECVDLRTGLPA